TQTRFYEELSSSGRPEEGKEVPLTIFRARRERDRKFLKWLIEEIGVVEEMIRRRVLSI
ncbi:hypothetical protein Taro_030557, partial [Colocasia esculenta]|nr:hypothetical protein [Colocasia esculenta]